MDGIEGRRDFDHRAVAWPGEAATSSLPATRCSLSSIPQAGGRLGVALALVADQKNRY
jgi:hypothetical protein